MPCDYSKYPADWKFIVSQIKQRAGNKCETCRVKNGAIIVRSECLNYWYDPLEDEIYHYPTGVKFDRWKDGEEPDLREKAVKIVCTTAHLDHDIKNNDEANLRFFCQLCHLRHDAKQHAETARRTRQKRYETINPPLELGP